jgi:hypothetical protein
MVEVFNSVCDCAVDKEFNLQRFSYVLNGLLSRPIGAI